MPNVNGEQFGDEVFGDISLPTVQGIRDNILDRFDSQKQLTWWQRTIGTQYHKAMKHPLFKRVFDAGQQFLNDVSQIAVNASNLAPTILPKMGSLGDVFKSGVSKENMAAVSKAVFQGMLTDNKVYTPAELRSQFGLDDKQVGIYQEFRAATDRMLDELLASEASRLTRGEVSAATLAEAKANPTRAVEIISRQLIAAGKSQLNLQLAESADRIRQLKEQGYAPLQRYGKYTVHVVGPNGEQHYYGTYETERESNKAAREMQAVFPDSVVAKGEMSPEAQRMLAGVSPDTMTIFAEAIGGSLGGVQGDMFREYLKRAANNRAALTKLIARDTAGFSRDMPQVLASFVTSTARMASKNYNMRELTEAAAAIPADQGDLRGDADRMVEYLKNPGEEAAALRGLLFTHFIGGSIASALTNLTQPVMQTLPYLSQWGTAQAARELAAASRMAATGAKGDAVIEKAMAEANASGLLEPHELSQLHAETSRGFMSNPGIQKGLKVWGSFFAVAETFNRKATFIAAYRIALTLSPEQMAAAGVNSPMAFAAKAIAETQGIYNRGNRPNWARGAVGATLFTFKQFGVSYLEFFNRLPPKQKLLAFAILVMAAGAQGLPFAEDIEDLIDTIGQSLGYDTNSKAGLHKLATEILGEGFGNFVINGVSAIPGVPLNVQGRLGMSNLIPGSSAFKRSSEDKLKEAFEVVGPVGGFVNALIAGAGKAQEGDWLGILKGTAPVAVQNAFKGIDMLQTGVYRDAKGNVVTKTDTGDAITKMIGFQPAGVAVMSNKKNDWFESQALNQVVHKQIAGQWARAAFENDPAKVADAIKALQTWNTRNPASPIRIDPADIRRRLIVMSLDGSQRAVKSAPKALRVAAMEAMQ